MRSPDRLRAGALLWAAACVALTGCAALRSEPASTTPASPPVTAPLPPAEPKPSQPQAPLSLVDWLQKARAMPGNELMVETQKLLDSGDGRARLQAALALAQPQHPARDDARAVALADEVARAPDTAAPLREVAGLLALWLDEQRRNDVNQRRAQTRAREDEARQQLTETRLREMEKRATDAEKKLEALRAIERDLSGRGAGNGRP